jgi:hypothetical protein
MGTKLNTRVTHGAKNVTAGAEGKTKCAKNALPEADKPTCKVDSSHVLNSSDHGKDCNRFKIFFLTLEFRSHCDHTLEESGIIRKLL